MASHACIDTDRLLWSLRGTQAERKCKSKFHIHSLQAFVTRSLRRCSSSFTRSPANKPPPPPPPLPPPPPAGDGRCGNPQIAAGGFKAMVMGIGVVVGGGWRSGRKCPGAGNGVACACISKRARELLSHSPACTPRAPEPSSSSPAPPSPLRLASNQVTSQRSDQRHIRLAPTGLLPGRVRGTRCELLLHTHTSYPRHQPCDSTRSAPSHCSSSIS